MLDRYGADMVQQRAIDAKRRMGDMYRSAPMSVIGSRTGRPWG
jgi:hypothetical protein